MVKKIYRQTFNFINNTKAEKYLLFLKRQALELNPNFYAVTNNREVDTCDGKMYTLRITNDIESPEFETIAELFINNQHIYIWRDHCWGIAVNSNGNEIVLPCQSNLVYRPGGIILSKRHSGVTRSMSVNPGIPFNKTIIVFKIGVDKI